jgi:hypothetical protein
MSKIIVEGATFQEAEVIKADSKKALFKMVCQTADEENQNHRLYPGKVLDEAMRNCRPRMKNRAFMGETDHPVPAGNEQHDGIRQTTVSLKEVSHIITDYEWQGNKLMAHFETTSTPNGYTILGLLKDGVGLGTSMRGMAELSHEGNVKVVQSPLYIICYDLVSLPSHKAAVVDFSEMRFEAKRFLHESYSCNSDGTICTPDGKCYLGSYFDKLVESRVITFFDKWV